jgi:putative addiction module component (TIGR02574 family)
MPTGRAWQDPRMAASTLTQLLQLPAAERAELAKNLWESLTDAERDRYFKPDQRAQIGRRLAAPVDSAQSPVAWQQVRRVLQGGD